jgi:hypothetical protein
MDSYHPPRALEPDGGVLVLNVQIDGAPNGVVLGERETETPGEREKLQNRPGGFHLFLSPPGEVDDKEAALGAH